MRSLTTLAAARDALAAIPALDLAPGATPVEAMPRLRAALGGGPRLLVKRDDAIPLAFGGNKVRKLRVVAAEALAQGADTLITCGGIQSNHARVTAAVAARLGLGCVLVASGERPARPTANALLDELLGARVRYVPTREARASAMEDEAQRVRAVGGRPFVIPLGASTPLGAAGYARAVAELCAQIDPPDVIVHASSSGGTQAGLLAGCLLHGLPTRVIGVSADEPAGVLSAEVAGILSGLRRLLGLDFGSSASLEVEVDDGFVGEGYGIPTPASRDALELAARTEGLLLDPTYTAKAMAALIVYVRSGRLREGQTVVFWHTGGQVGLFA
jgi:1-aminocyclopropane-1-carboxylate deaminase/D-cysteine desulfhydrase-like pyridoxal-dependent ACC family enzyme